MKRPILCDTTLRDGEQAPGVALTVGEKMTIARMLDEAGVQEIEAGTPAMGREECDAVKGIVSLGLKGRVLAWNRAVISDMDASMTCGATALAISLPVSDLQIEKKLGKDRSWVLAQLRRTLEYAESCGLYVCVGAEDASRSDPDFLCDFALAAACFGADRIRFSDTVGLLDPIEVYRRVSELAERVPLPIEVHTHNDFGMATANAMAGLRAGAQVVSTTVLGIGERAGNAALEQVVMALKKIYGVETGIRTEMLGPLCCYVARTLGREIPPSQPVAGASIFQHESGIHADGILKETSLYEPYDPGEVGLTREIVIGKHSGSRALLHAFHELGIHLDPLQVPRLLDQVRSLSLRIKRSVTARELIGLYEKMLNVHPPIDRRCLSPDENQAVHSHT